jgi:hypothetical protein
MGNQEILNQLTGLPDLPRPTTALLPQIEEATDAVYQKLQSYRESLSQPENRFYKAQSQFQYVE